MRNVSTASLTLAVLSCSTSAFVLQSPPAITCRSTEVFSKLDKVDKGFNLLGQRFVPQGPIVATVKGGWNLIWRRMMAELAPQDRGGKYRRPEYVFQGKIEPEQDLHVYLGEACPWCHRVKLTIKLKGIEMVSVTQLVDDPTKASRGGWILAPGDPDPIFASRDLAEVYERLSPGFEGRCTAPLLVDKKQKKIVSNESSEICRMLNGLPGTRGVDLYPDHLAGVIDETNEWIYTLLNNGVYQCGFSTSQRAYDEASASVRLGLQRADDLLNNCDFLCGSMLTESDVRLLPTALRFDGVYAPLFRAGGAHLRIRDYPSLHNWLKRCWQLHGVKESVDLAKANGSYYSNLFPLNPSGIVPSAVTPSGLGLE